MATNRREWEDALVQRAVHFTCSVPCTAPRPRGQRMQWLVTEHPRLLFAVRHAVSEGDRALVYAVDATGASAPLSRADWPRYLALRGES